MAIAEMPFGITAGDRRENSHLGLGQKLVSRPFALLTQGAKTQRRSKAKNLPLAELAVVPFGTIAEKCNDKEMF